MPNETWQSDFTHYRVADHTDAEILGWPVLVHGLDARVINSATGELIRALVIDPTKDYQPLGRPPGPQSQKPR